MRELDAGKNQMLSSMRPEGARRRGRGEFERARWILASYVTSPAFLLVAGCGMISLVVLWILPDRYYRYYPVHNDPSSPAMRMLLARDPPLILCLLPPIVFLAIGIGIPLSLQFRNPLARLAPGFAKSHRMVGVALASAVVLLTGMQLMIGGAEAIGAFVVPASVVAASIAYTAFTLNAGWAGLQGKALWLVYPHVAIMVAIGFVVGILYPNQILWGEYPGALVLLAVVTVVECGSATWALSHLVEWSFASVTPGRAPGSKWGHPVARSFGLARIFPGWRAERRLEGLSPATARWNWWNRIARWRLGNPPMPIHGSSLYFMMLLGEVALIFLLGLHLIQSALSVGLIVYFICNWFFLVTFQVSFRWRTRMPILSLELMRPVSRRRLLSELIAAILIDLAPVCVEFAAMLAFALNLDAKLRVEWARVPAEFCLWLVVGFLVQIEAAAVQIVIQRLWLACTAMILSLFVNIAVVLALLATNPNWKPSTVTLAMIESHLWGPALIAVIVTAIMARRFFQMEIGRRV